MSRSTQLAVQRGDSMLSVAFAVAGTPYAHVFASVTHLYQGHDTTSCCWLVVMDSERFASPIKGIFCGGLNAYCMHIRPLFLRTSGSSGVLKALLLALSDFFRAVCCRRRQGTTLQHLRDLPGVAQRQKMGFDGSPYKDLRRHAFFRSCSNSSAPHARRDLDLGDVVFGQLAPFEGSLAGQVAFSVAVLHLLLQERPMLMFLLP